MFVMRNRPRGARFASFGLGLCVFALIPTEVGYQDIASLLARQPGVAERWQKRVFSPTVSTIQVATFSFGRPIGTALPRTAAYLLASLETQGNDIVGAVTRNPLMKSPPRYQAADFPQVNRTLKGDRLAIVAPEEVKPESVEPSLDDPSTSIPVIRGEKTAAVPVPLDSELADALNAPPLSQYDISMSLEAEPLDDLKGPAIAHDAATAASVSPDGFSVKTASLYFGASSLGVAGETLQRWQPGEEPTVVLPGAPDPDMKATAVLPVDPGVVPELTA